MNKSLLSFVSLLAWGVAQSSVGLVAAPADGPGSAAESDRQFLNKLENNAAADPASAPAPAPAPEPAPRVPAVQPTAPSAPPALRRAQSTQDQTVIRGSWSDTASGTPATPRPAKTTSRSTAAAPRSDASPARSTTSTRHEIPAGQIQSADTPADSGPGVRTRIYRPSSVDGATTTTTTKTPARRTTLEVAPDEEGTHIVRPPEIAQYGVAPTVPARTTRTTTTTTYLPAPNAVPAPRQADGNESRDEDRNQEHRFFHRLFHGGLFNKHGEDRD